MTLYEDFFYKFYLCEKDDDEIDIKPPKSNPLFEKWIKIGLASIVIIIPIPGLMELVFFVYNTNRYKCFAKCSKHKDRQKICHYKCRELGAKWTLEWIESELEQCDIVWDHEPTKKKKCNKKLSKIIPKWQFEEQKWKSYYEGHLEFERSKCLDKCDKVKDNKTRQSDCESDCEKVKAKFMVKRIQKNLRKCKTEKCQKSMYKLLDKWKHKTGMFYSG